MKKNYIGLIILILIGGAVAFVYYNNKENPDEVFRSYIQKSASLKEIYQTQSMEGTNSKADLEGQIITNNKEYKIFGDLVCDGEIDGNKISTKSSLNLDGEKRYIRLNEISGLITNDEGVEINLTTAYSNGIGKWFVLSEEDPQLKAQLDSGVYIFNSLLMAPSYDSNLIANKMIESGAFSYTSYSVNDGVYEFKFISKRSAYLEVIKELFPNISNPDLIIDTVFEDDDTQESTLYIDSDGNLKSEKLSDSNICQNIIETFVFEGAQGIPLDVSGEVVVKSKGDVNIEPVTNPQTIDTLYDNLVL